MQARRTGRPSPSSQARLQLLLIVLAAWDFISYLIELANARLIAVDDVSGVLGARALSGASVVLAIAYLYAARNPVRYRFVLWLAALEQCVALFSTTFHWARGDIGFGESAVPIIVSAGFLILLMANLPRQTDTIGA